MSAISGPAQKLGITVPTLVLDRERVLRNIERMAARAESLGIKLRPHFKTHQSVEIGGWFRDRRVDAITVSSVRMARYFADGGWSDITIAFPVNLLELPEIAALARSVELGVLVDSDTAVGALAGALESPAHVWVKIDTGYGRAGLAWDAGGRVASLVELVRGAGPLTFAGILTHNGLTYRERTVDGVRRVHRESLSRMLAVKESLERRGLGTCQVSIGDTPSACLAEDFESVDELRPGNFVFHDLTQAAIGSCVDEDIAVAVACPVVGKYEDRHEIIVYGGAVHLSTESIRDDTGKEMFGCLASGSDGSLGRALRDAPVVSISQEHGVVRVTDRLLSDIAVGDVVLVLPVHSCLTSSLYSEYRTLDGETISRMPSA